MAKIKEIKPENHTDHPYDNGAIGAIASAASAGVALGASLGIAAGLPGLIAGAAIGATVGAVGALAVTEEMDYPHSVLPAKKKCGKIVLTVLATNHFYARCCAYFLAT